VPKSPTFTLVKP